ncbi:hypothetical protein AB833_18160 [Chromatiales bacterium (ex Bugula neritina AB1)]|nr:hypothetical protein AB833_18160 [Chromatiales bacterium (ex Bugula neritina AB1)]
MRRARPADVHTLTQIAFRSKQSNGYDDKFMQACKMELAVTESDLESSEFWVAERDALCGFVCLRLIEGSAAGEVASFFIDPDHQQQGIGSLLWQALLQRARQLELTNLQLASDPAATGFYENLGFRVSGQVPSGSIAGRTLPQMTLDLSQ